MDEEKRKALSAAMDRMSRSYRANLPGKADELAIAAERWRDGEADAQEQLIDLVHRMVSAGSFGLSALSERASIIQDRLIAGHGQYDELVEFIAYIRGEATG
ncbi:MAG: hypothetical protein AAGC55_04825 [Myxococcota bacterium]